MEVEQLIETLTSIEDPLRRSNHSDEAQWLLNKRATLIHGASDHGASDQIRVALEEIRSHIYGMGSLSDLYLRPTAELGMTSVEARKVLLDLLEHLYYEIAYLLAMNSPKDSA